MKIEMKNICKFFGNVQILKNVNFKIQPAEIHALVGENGAGKSTLMKILIGDYQKDSGQIFVNDKIVQINKIKDSEDLGISIIHQELNILPYMSVVENMFLGHEIKNKFGILNNQKMNKLASEAIRRLGLEIDSETRASNLTVGQLQLVEIGTALLKDAKLIIMDEPTSALSEREIERLFKTIRELRSQGVSFVYISHRMEELFELCDKVTVMRDGQFIDEKDVKDTNFEELVSMMVGREIGQRFPQKTNKVGEVILEVKNLSLKGKYNDVSFNLKKGEVLGFSGLMGAGRTEVMHALFGSIPAQKGDIFIEGRLTKIKSPQDAMRHGIAFVTEDRKKEGLFLNFTVEYNIFLPNLKELSELGIVSNRKIIDYVKDLMGRFKVKTASTESEVKNLSGGNQQKVVLSKWLGRKPFIIILDEPTRGVDVGAKKEIYEMIDKLSAQGVAIIMVSSELPEIIGMCDRVAVMMEGHITGILERTEFSQEKIISLAAGGIKI